ncbi:MAG: hypothetical protein ACOY5R_22185 [Pseudomonadota bacterium]
MARSIIYTVDPSGTTLTAMRPSQPRSEDLMQRLVAAYPQLIADQDGELLLIRREQPVGDHEESNGRWSLDHLFVTRTGVPVLVELKRAVDTRLRREVVGQMLDYAANSTVYWKSGRIADVFAATMAEQGRDAEIELASFIGADADPQQFWQQVDTNFSAGRIKLVFVADTIPRELARIVEFLNEQMKADVRAVELNWFESEDGVTALTPRIIGETERAQNEKVARGPLPPIARETWIDERLGVFGADTVAAANAYVQTVEEAGGMAGVTDAQAAIYSAFSVPGGTLYPLSLSAPGRGQISLNLAYLKSRPVFATDEARQDLLDRLTAIVGPLSTSKLGGFPTFPCTKLNDPSVRAGLRDFLEHVRTVASVAP